MSGLPSPPDLGQGIRQTVSQPVGHRVRRTDGFHTVLPSTRALLLQTLSRVGAPLSEQSPASLMKKDRRSQPFVLGGRDERSLSGLTPAWAPHLQGGHLCLDSWPPGL